MELVGSLPLHTQPHASSRPTVPTVTDVATTHLFSTPDLSIHQSSLPLTFNVGTGRVAGPHATQHTLKSLISHTSVRTVGLCAPQRSTCDPSSSVSSVPGRLATAQQARHVWTPRRCVGPRLELDQRWQRGRRALARSDCDSAADDGSRTQVKTASIGSSVDMPGRL